MEESKKKETLENLEYMITEVMRTRATMLTSTLFTEEEAVLNPSSNINVLLNAKNSRRG